MKLVELTFVKDLKLKDYRKVLINPEKIVGVFNDNGASVIKFDSTNANDLIVKESFDEIIKLID